MSRNTRVSSRIWNEERFTSLSDKAKLAYFFIATHPHMTAIGGLRGTLPGLAAELGWSLKGFQKAFLELVQAGLVRCAEKAPLIWLPWYLKDNRPESPNVVKSWHAILGQLPDCPERADLLIRVLAFSQTWGDAFYRALPEAFHQVLPTAPVAEENSAGTSEQASEVPQPSEASSAVSESDFESTQAVSLEEQPSSIGALPVPDQLNSHDVAEIQHCPLSLEFGEGIEGIDEAPEVRTLLTQQQLERQSPAQVAAS